MSAPRIQTERVSAEINLGYYALPSETNIGAFVLGNMPDSGQVVTHFEAKMRGR
ncbi:hypothetical protein BS47DRAFT_1356178, partial [Hydnum rufescens UP504]